MSTYAQYYSSLTLREKIGQMFFIGLPGEDLDETGLKLISEISPGGVCLFARNAKNGEKTRNLLDGVRGKLKFEPFLSLDQEGGLVDRLRRIVEPIPSARDISRKGDLDKVRRLAEITAEVVRILGFNLNLAPVIDVINPSREGFIMANQSRCFGNSKEDVLEFTGAYLETLQNGGCLGCLKHFPGIGGVQFDPHEELPSVDVSKDEFYETDLFPFINHFKAGNVRAVMTGHTAFPLLDLQERDSSGKLLPSSLSYNIVTKLLRDELGFENLALTDDLEMGAIVKNYGIGAASKMSIMAGNDFVLICNDPGAILDGFNAVLGAVETGEIPESRIDESLERIWRVREALSAPLEFDESRLEELSQETRELKESL
ncbi:MAG: glycoside hydrolase family 3 protein [Acidobacteria bacterium]|nr:glycoside hydrolase family 3 protein [Acidobacteriota bacterium]